MKYLIVFSCIVLLCGVAPVHAQTATPAPTTTATVTPTTIPTPAPVFGPVTLQVSNAQARQEEGAALTAGLGIGFIVVVVGVFLHIWIRR